MNLEDVLDPEYGLQQDEWSLSKPTFVDEGQLKVIGWSGKQESNSSVKYYILKCSKCCQDSELFGEGYFRMPKANLIKKAIPCGCSRKPYWSKDQFHTLCSRKAVELGYTFLGFTGEWRGSRTKMWMFCEKHGEWKSGDIANFMRGTGCVGCKIDNLAKINTKPDNQMITSFFNSKSFALGTKFWRSSRKNNNAAKVYWFMTCPDCGETGESTSSCLQEGKRPCACSKQRQQECYINWITDGDSKVALKFGVANNSKQRIKAQNRVSSYEVKQYQVYKFPDVASCKKAERECKKELECGILLKRDMPDGYSETTWVYNLSKIQDIYKRNGGEII